MATEIIPTGAYVIRNKKTSGALHICCADVAAVSGSQTVAYSRDEIKFREQQIWWVERLPEYEDDTAHEQGPVYSITNTASGLSLDVSGASTTNGARVTAFPGHGGYNQRWRLRGVQDTSSEDERVIVSVQSGSALTIGDPESDPPSPCHIWEYLPQDPRQSWDFVRPVVAIPVGWVEIVNVGSGDILTQTYISSPPRLVHPSDQYSNLKPPEYRERWGTQWTLVLPTTHQPQGCDSSGTWIIKNRLTGARLRNSSYPREVGQQLSVVAVMNQGFVKVWPFERWILELETDNTWKIRNQGGSCYLEETEVRIGDGKELACVSESFKRGDTSKMWRFRKVCDHKD